MRLLGAMGALQGRRLGDQPDAPSRYEPPRTFPPRQLASSPESTRVEVSGVIDMLWNRCSM